MMNDTSIYLRALMMGNNCYSYKKIVGVYRIHEKNITGKSVKAEFIIKNF